MASPTAPARANRSVGRRRLGRTERSEAILVAAAGAFAVGGFAGTAMAEIAAAAEVSHLIVYRHFESKEALYTGVLRRSVDRLAARFASPDAVDRFGPTAAAILEVARGDSAGFRVLWRHATREPDFARWVDTARDILHSSARAALEPMVAAEIREWAIRAQVAYVVEAVLHWIEYGDPDLDDRFLAATRAALRAGIRTWST
jgi:AcrR family transcriptional regulator